MNLYHVQDSETWKQASKEARSEFIEVMRACQYSAAATKDAWDWFYIGWTCRDKLLPAPKKRP